MEEEYKNSEEEGAAGWIMTFADLMSLLMCFFVLLLAFSEMDVLKFKQLSGSMKEAFGVQREIKADEIPKGTSIVAQEFSPGKPTPTPIVQLRQQTTDETKDNLDFSDSDTKSEDEDIEELKKALKAEMSKQIREQYEAMREALKDDIDEGLIEISKEKEEIIIRIREKGSFNSGSAKLQNSFTPILKKIGYALTGVTGNIVVSGHTDNVPIFTSRFQSNWVLSAARAASVVHHLTKYTDVPGEKIEIRAHGDTIPIESNSTPDGRARNRRVEISVRFSTFEAINAKDIQSTLDSIESYE